MVKFNVYLNEELIDGVFYLDGFTPEQVKKSLVEHDGYDPGIEVRCE